MCHSSNTPLCQPCMQHNHVELNAVCVCACVCAHGGRREGKIIFRYWYYIVHFNPEMSPWATYCTLLCPESKWQVLKHYLKSICARPRPSEFTSQILHMYGSISPQARVLYQNLWTLRVLWSILAVPKAMVFWTEDSEVVPGFIWSHTI